MDHNECNEVDTPSRLRQFFGTHKRREGETGRTANISARTHVLLPLWSLPRRRDAIETVGDALFRAANGHGHRSIARELALPPSTVRNWLRRARGRAEWLRQRAVQAGHEIDVCLPFSPPRASLLAEALDALGLTAWAAIRRFGWAGTSPWRVIAALSGGHLLSRGPDG